MSINSSTNTILGKRLHDSDNYNETKYAVQAPVNTKSELWEYFRQYVSTTAKKDHAVCNICYKLEMERVKWNYDLVNPDLFEINYTTSKSTDKLERHLADKHESEYLTYQEKKIDISNNNEQSILKFLTKDVSKDSYLMELIRFISENYLSFSIVQSSSFKSLVTKLNKNAKHHDRHTIRKKTVEMAAILKQKIKLLLKNKFVSITCDKWTSNVNQSYLGVTAHIIDDDWKMKSFVLTCSPTNSSIGSTAEELYTDITEVVTDYELDNSNISAIVTDTEPTMRKFGRLVTERNGVRWLGCISHLLELCTKTLATVDSDRDVDDENKTGKTCLKQYRRLVGKFKHSAKLTQRLLFLQNKQNPLVLKECVSTCWWNTYTMLESIIALENSLKYLESENEIDCNDKRNMCFLATIHVRTRIVRR